MKDHDTNADDPLDPADPVNRDSVSDSWGRAAAYDAYADGLHTYALGGLRNHEAAASAVYCAFVAADHHVAHLGDAEMLRPWLYAITRHFCRLGKLPRLRLAPPPSAAAAKDADKERTIVELERSLLAAELTSLDWPDTDGLGAAHREVLELSVRHGMESRAVGLILGKPAAESFELLSAAWHELERSLAATALLRTTRSHCPDLAALASGWSGRLTAERREPLVAHVDVCSRCQFHLHKVLGAPRAPSILPHVPAPKALRDRVLGALLDSSAEKAAEKAVIAGRLARFDVLGFPETEAVLRPRPQPRPVVPAGGAAAITEKKPRLLGALLAGRMSSAADAQDREPLGVRASAAGERDRDALGGVSRRSAGARVPVAGARDPRSTRESTGTRASARGGDAGARNGARGETFDGVSAGGGSVFEDSRFDRAAPGVVPQPRRNSVAAAIEGRRRGAADVKRGATEPRPVSDAYEAAATVAAAMAAEDPAPNRVPTIAPAPSAAGSRRGPRAQAPAHAATTQSFTRPPAAPTRRRKSAFRSALTSSAILSGAGAAGVTAFVLFVPSSADGNKTLYTPPVPGGSSAQTPDYPRPSSTAAAGPSLPVAGKAGGGPGWSSPGGETVTAQVIAVVVAVTPSTPAPTSGSPTPPVGSVPWRPLPSATTGPSQDPTSDTGQLNISVKQRSNNPNEVTVTLWNSGTAPVSWAATADVRWLSLSAVSGMLAPGAQTSVRIVVDHRAEPNGPWRAHVRFDPSGEMIALGGSGSGKPGAPSSTPTTAPSTTPSTAPSTAPSSSSSSSGPSGTPSSTPSAPPSTPSSTPSGTPGSTPSTSPPAPSSAPSQPSTTPTGTPSRPRPTVSPTRPRRR
ncbi:MAG: BACON domain-containing protein [Catenulispora sp.]